MKNKILFYSIALFLFYAIGLCTGCDKPLEQPPPPYAPQAVKSRSTQPEVTDFMKKTYANKQELTEIYWYVVETYDEVKELQKNLEKYHGENEIEFSRYQAQWRKKTIEWERMIKLRIERFKLNPMDLPKDHPRHKMYRALHLLRELINNYAQHYFMGWELNPKLEQDLNETLDQAKSQIDRMEE